MDAARCLRPKGLLCVCVCVYLTFALPEIGNISRSLHDKWLQLNGLCCTFVEKNVFINTQTKKKSSLLAFFFCIAGVLFHSWKTTTVLVNFLGLLQVDVAAMMVSAEGSLAALCYVCLHRCCHFLLIKQEEGVFAEAKPEESSRSPLTDRRVHCACVCVCV